MGNEREEGAMVRVKCRGSYGWKEYRNFVSNLPRPLVLVIPRIAVMHAGSSISLLAGCRQVNS